MHSALSRAALTGLMREPEGLVPNALAIGYAVLGHLVGLALLVSADFGWLALGVLLTTHSMVIAAYLIHEAAHMTLLREQRNNRFVGELMSWICGAAYASFKRIRHMHIRHHRDRADVTRFNYKRWLEARSALTKRLIHGLEWAYIPAVELILHYQVLLRPFVWEEERERRARVLWVGASRLALFALLFWLSPVGLLAFALSYLLFLTVLNINDAFHHTFDQYFVDTDDQRVPMEGKDRAYEQAHTYSNVLSAKRPWLNVLSLNFGYHNAHHERAAVPWYRLPALHRQLFGEHSRELMAWPELLRTFHRNRLRRILDEDYGQVGTGHSRADGFVGAHGVSFLTVV